MLLIKSGTIITASETFVADILCDGEKILQIGQNLQTDEQATDDHTIIIDASNKYVMPGGVDVHTHFDLPMFNTITSDDHYTGHKAAAFGGTTTVIDFVPQDNINQLLDNVDTWHQKADKNAAIDFGFHMNISHYNTRIEHQLPDLLTAGISSIKVFTAYNNRLRLSDGEIFQVLRDARKYGFLTMLHAENGDVIDILVNEALSNNNLSPAWHARTRPAWGSVESTFRAAALAAQANAPIYIVHTNAGGEIDQIKYAQRNGVRIFGETCPQYLVFSNEVLERPDGAKWVCSPPIRTQKDCSHIWDGLTQGVLDVIATDHCSFFFNGEQAIQYEGQTIKISGKELGKDDFTKIPNGLPGVGDRLPIIWTEGVVSGKISANRFVALNCTNPAKIFGLYPEKGTIMPGSDADIVIWNPHKEVEYGVNIAQHRTDYNLYEGWKLHGFPEMTILRGKIIVDKGIWKGKRGAGTYLKRKPFNEKGI